ncbi:MAG TPA: S-layer homology domain-containing protein, partial [Chloroflexia bacterium]|nr:S-layer homology domain-containing protein [Chloroflexia bacterium]
PAGPPATPTPADTPRPPSSTPTGTPASPPTPPPSPTQTPGGPSATPVATTTPCPLSFADVHASDYFAGPVLYLACRDVISGYSDSTFRPYNTTTRAQQVKIIVLGFSIPISTPAAGAYTFADVPPSFPFWSVIETATGHSLVSGYGCGGPGEPCDRQNRPYFRPYANVTRGQLAKMVTGAAGWPLITPAGPSFADVLPGSAFYLFVETAAGHGVISGYACGGRGEPCDGAHRPYFRQYNNATRGQVAKIVYGALIAVPAGPAAGYAP